MGCGGARGETSSALHDRVSIAGAEPVDSRLAFETAFFSRTAGRFDTVHRALFKAYFEDGRDIGNVDILLDIANECGVDRTELRPRL